MKKIIALLACLCLLLPMSVYFVGATGGELTVKEAIDLALSQEHNVYPETKYTVTAEIKEVYNEVYGNMRVVDAEGNVLTLYGTYSADGALRYDAMDVKPVAGDTITVYGVVGQYNGTPQIKNGWIINHIPGEGGGNQPEAPAVSLVDAPVAGTAYKFGMIQPNVSATAIYYLAGGMSGFYMVTSTDLAAAIDVYLEATEGGYYLYGMVDGAKQYINMIISDTGHVNGAYEAAASTVYTYDANAKTIIANVNEADQWFGTRNDKSYTTVGPCKVEYAGFYCQFYATENNDNNDDNDDNGDEPSDPSEPSNPDLPAPSDENTLSIKEALELGATTGDNVYTEEKYYVTGKIVVAPTVPHGNMYIEDENGDQLYVYGTWSADGATKYGDMEEKPDAGDTVTLYGSLGSYMSKPQMKNGWIISYEAGELEEENTDPEADSILTIKEAIALGSSKLHDVYTEGKYYITGEITEVYNEQYGNMRVTDAEGNILTVYGSYSEDGSTRYGDMEVKPVAGDTVVLYGIIGQYNGTAQMKNAWIVPALPEVDDDNDDDKDDIDDDKDDIDDGKDDIDDGKDDIDDGKDDIDDDKQDDNKEDDKQDDNNKDETKDEQSKDETDVPGETKPMGENVTGIVIAAILVILAVAGIIVFTKKRA